jgi:hypothetical protein
MFYLESSHHSYNISQKLLSNNGSLKVNTNIIANIAA